MVPVDRSWLPWLPLSGSVSLSGEYLRCFYSVGWSTNKTPSFFSINFISQSPVFSSKFSTDASERDVLIFKPCKKFGVPHIASNILGQVPHESTSITRTIITRSATSGLSRKRRSQLAVGKIIEKSSSSSEGLSQKSKRAKRTEEYWKYLDEYRVRQDKCLDDPSLPKLEKPFQHLQRYNMEQKATQQGTSSGTVAAEKLLKQAKKTPSPPTARPQGHSLPAQDVDNHVAMPPPTAPPLRRHILKQQSPVSVSTMPLNMSKTQPMSQTRPFSGNISNSDSERTRGATATVHSVVNSVSSQTYQQTTEMRQHWGNRGMLGGANIPRGMAHRLSPIPMENRLGTVPLENRLGCIPA